MTPYRCLKWFYMVKNAFQIQFVLNPFERRFLWIGKKEPKVFLAFFFFLRHDLGLNIKPFFNTRYKSLTLVTFCVRAHRIKINHLKMVKGVTVTHVIQVTWRYNLKILKENLRNHKKCLFCIYCIRNKAIHHDIPMAWAPVSEHVFGGSP